MSSSLVFLAVAFTTTFVIVSSLPSNDPNLETPDLTELPPDIAPLLPSAGGTAQPPVGAFFPIIPSTRSPPNPDITGSTGRDTAFGPSGLLEDSSAVSQVIKGYNVDVFMGFLTFWLVLVIIV
ncbi:hypothetical protein CDL12_13001 [Handroanthus impetiginosus]|uniref:Transmembrane protein n=1 Tax=Handroanthus impetiginosus TaxID=429701 RepID=A0A2G9HA30_9LAMI|nr:hypothetical protein CDL12_13001 [Handroanthus impetiginosus]